MEKKNKVIISLIIFSMLFVSYGCAKATKKPPKPTTKPITGTPQSTTAGEITTTPPATTILTAVPKELTGIENYAVKIMTDINSKRWKTAGNKYKSIKTDLTKLSTKLSMAGVQTATINNIVMSIDNLNRDLSAKKVFDSKVDANELTRYVTDAMSAYKVSVPTNFSKLDYYFRDIELNLPSKNWAKVGEDLVFIKSIWESSKVLVNTADKNIKKMDTVISSLQTDFTNRNASKTLSATKKALTDSSAIKKNFAKIKKKV